MTTQNLLDSTIKQLAAKGKGILAADESTATIGKRFTALNITSTEETRRAYRELLFTTPGLNEAIAGVILYEETLGQKSNDGIPLPDLLLKNGILPGIKVDKGLVLLPNTQEENTTQGLDGLAERLTEYKTKGARFAKWRAVYNISSSTPSNLAIRTNAEGLARYAAICQSVGIVPIVEPEILYDGNHTIQTCAEVTEKVLHKVFSALYKNKVSLEHIILKPSMVISGKNCPIKASVEEVATETIKILRRTVPAAVPTINFLSGGQTPQDATAHLNAMHTIFPSLPWNLSYSYARALQDDCIKLWLGDSKNTDPAQKALYKRAKLNSLASQGMYTADKEKETSLA